MAQNKVKIIQDTFLILAIAVNSKYLLQCYFRLQEKIKMILQATYQHGRNLACFTFLYKVINAILAKSSGQLTSVRGGRKTPWHVILAASTAGYFVFGTNNPINTQVSTVSFYFRLVMLQLGMWKRQFANRFRFSHLMTQFSLKFLYFRKKKILTFLKLKKSGTSKQSKTMYYELNCRAAIQCFH